MNAGKFTLGSRDATLQEVPSRISTEEISTGVPLLIPPGISLGSALELLSGILSRVLLGIRAEVLLRFFSTFRLGIY